MEYKLGNSIKIKENGLTELLTCPNCNKKVNFSVFNNGEIKIVSSFPLIENGKVYFIVCPECASVFGIDDRAGKSFEKGNQLSIGNFDLKELDKFKD